MNYELAQTIIRASAGVYDDLSEEIQEHLEEKVEELVESGMSRKDAAAAARRAFGNVGLTEESSREVWRRPSIEDLFMDLRYGLRTLRTNPGFTAVAILTLALGIGANTAIFSVVYAVVLKPLPYANPEQLFNVFQVKPQEGITGTGWSYANFSELREQNRVFSGMAGSQHHQLTLTGHGAPSVVNTSVVTPELSRFSARDLSPGRVFSFGDGKRGRRPSSLLSEGLWRGSFRADRQYYRKRHRSGQAFFYGDWNHAGDVSLPGGDGKRATLDPARAGPAFRYV